MGDTITFAGSPLDRAALARRDAAWIERQLARDATRFLPLWQLKPLVKLGESCALAWARRELFADVEPAPAPVLLGLDGGVAHFAVDVSAVADPEASFGVADVARFEELRAIAAQLPPAGAAIAAQARSLVDWHARHGFCAACGSRTLPMLGGAHRRCPECAAEHFPRTDPVAIAVVGCGDRCLLGRAPRWPDTMFSALAGFVEPGETIEEAVRREVREESGVAVGRVRYLMSQPWPFPSSLMIGCLAEATSEALAVDRSELAEARWFGLDEIRAALAGRPGPLTIPPALAVANHLIRAWADSRGR